jgi:hypothetical protein
MITVISARATLVRRFLSTWPPPGVLASAARRTPCSSGKEKALWLPVSRWSFPAGIDRDRRSGRPASRPWRSAFPQRSREADVFLEACIVTVEADPPQGSRLAAFLADRPAAQIQPNIVPKIGDQPWARSVFDAWDKAAGLSRPVKAAIKRWRENGNVTPRHRAECA